MTDYASTSPDAYPGDPTGSTRLSTGDYHRLLAEAHRRVALDVLAEWSGPVALDDLATAVVTRDPDADEADPEAVTRVARMLHHAHLPLMDDVGVVDYHPETHSVEPTHLRSTS